MAKLLMTLLLSCLALLAQAKDAAPAADDPVLEASVQRITAELRCLVCQNQTIADSHAELAVDLRRQVREMIAAGKTDDDVRDFMVARYGDFVLYKPPVTTRTYLLWASPVLLLLVGLGSALYVIRQRAARPLGADDNDEAPAAAHDGDPRA